MKRLTGKPYDVVVVTWKRLILRFGIQYEPLVFLVVSRLHRIAFAILLELSISSSANLISFQTIASNLRLLALPTVIPSAIGTIIYFGLGIQSSLCSFGFSFFSLYFPRKFFSINCCVGHLYHHLYSTTPENFCQVLEGRSLWSHYYLYRSVGDSVVRDQF